MDNETAADDEFRKISLPSNADFLLGAAYYCDQTKLSLDKFVFNKPEYFFDKVQQFLKENTLQFYDAVPELTPYLNQDEIDILITNLSKDIIVLKGGENDIKTKILILHKLVKAPEKQDVKLPLELTKIVDDGILFKVANLEESNDTPDEDLIVSIIDIFIRIHPDFSVNGIDFQNGRLGNLKSELEWIEAVKEGKKLSDSIVRRLANSIIKQAKITKIMQYLASNPGENQLYVKILKAVALDSALHSPDLFSFIKNYVVLKSELSESINQFLAVVGKVHKSEIWNDLTFSDLSIEFVKDISSRSEQGWLDCLRWLTKKIINISSEDWDEILSENQHIADLVSFMSENADLTLKPEVLKDVIINHSIEICTDTTTSTIMFDGIFNALPTHTQTGTAKDFLEKLDGKSITPDGIDKLWNNCKTLLEKVDITEKPQLGVRKLLIPIVQGNVTNRATLIVNLCRKLTNVVKQFDEITLGELKEQLESTKEALVDDEAGTLMINNILKTMSLGSKQKNIKNKKE